MSLEGRIGEGTDSNLGGASRSRGGGGTPFRVPRHIVLLLGCGVAAVPSMDNVGMPRGAAQPAIGMRGLEWAMNICETKVPTT